MAPERAEVVTEVVTAVETVEVAKAEARVVVVKEEEVKAVEVMVAVARAAAAAEARAAEARVVVVMGGEGTEEVARVGARVEEVMEGGATGGGAEEALCSRECPGRASGP